MVYVIREMSVSTAKGTLLANPRTCAKTHPLIRFRVGGVAHPADAADAASTSVKSSPIIIQEMS